MAALLAWLFLCAWDIWADPVPPNLYKAVGLFYVPQAKLLPDGSAAETSARDAILESHLTSLRSAKLLEKAEERVRVSYPELKMLMPRLRVSTKTQPLFPEIEVSGVSSEPSYMQALINELMSEHLANKTRERDEAAAKKRDADDPAEGRAYSAAIQRLLECQRDITTLKQRMEKVEGTHRETDYTLATLREQLTEAEARYTQAKGAFDQFPPEPCTEPYGILRLAKSEPYTHGMNPYSLIVYHPWRALASAGLAWILAVLLFNSSPHCRTRSSNAPADRSVGNSHSWPI